MLGVFVVLTTSSGFGFYNVAVLLEALTSAGPGTSEGAFSVAEVSAVTAFYFVCSGLAGLGIARLIERLREKDSKSQ